MKLNIKTKAEKQAFKYDLKYIYKVPKTVKVKQIKSG